MANEEKLVFTLLTLAFMCVFFPASIRPHTKLTGVIRGNSVGLCKLVRIYVNPRKESYLYFLLLCDHAIIWV